MPKLIKNIIKEKKEIAESGIPEITSWSELSDGTEDGELIAYSDGTNKLILSWDNSNSEWDLISTEGEWVEIENWSSTSLNTDLWTPTQGSVGGNISINTSQNRIEVDCSGDDTLKMYINAFKTTEGVEMRALNCNTSSVSVSSGLIAVALSLSYSTDLASNVRPRIVTFYRRVCCTSNQFQIKYQPPSGGDTVYFNTGFSNTDDRDVYIGAKRFIEANKPNFEGYLVVSGTGVALDNSLDQDVSPKDLNEKITPVFRIGKSDPTPRTGTIYAGPIYIKK